MAYKTFNKWVQDHRTQIEDRLHDAGVAFINANAVNCSAISELSLGDNKWYYLDKAKSQGYQGNFEPSKNGKSINLNLTYHQFKDDVSISFKGSYEIVHEMWEEFKKDHPFRKSLTTSEALAQYNQLPATGTSQYLINKQCQATDGIRFGHDFIVIPMHDQDGTIKSVQFVYDDGTKLFPKGPKERGLYFPIGRKLLRDEGDTVIMCESIATGLTLWKSQECHTRVTFGVAGLLPVVAQTLRYSELSRIIIAADNDHKTTGNPGLKKAHAVALKHDCEVTYPNFDEDDKGTDFNDLHVSSGIDAVDDNFWDNLYTPKKPTRPKTTNAELPNPADQKVRENKLGKTTDFNLTDVGNSERFAEWQGEQVKYCHEMGKWFTWDGTKWAVDNGKIIGLAINTVKRIYNEANESDQKLRIHALKSENVARIRGLVTLAQAKCQIELDQFDRDKMALNVGNGILDLTDGTLRPHDPDKNHSKIAGTNYDKSATCPIWLTFLDKIFAGNTELIEFIQRAIGYSLTADITEEMFLILWGNGNNGKSTLTDTIGAVLGDYTRVAAPDIFMRNKVNQHPTEIAGLKGARFVSSEESDKNIRLNEGRIKMMTGTRKITARMMRQDFFEFEQEYKLWFATNHKPVITGTDTGIWRRIQLVPFTVKIPEHEVDKHLLKKLDKELSGILTWAVEGCLAWQRGGIQIPDIVKAATEEYRLESDVLGNFIEDCCVLDPKTRVKTGELYTCYEKWCDDNGERALNNANFGKQIKERGIDKIKSHGVGFYLGLYIFAGPPGPHFDEPHVLSDIQGDQQNYFPGPHQTPNGDQGDQGDQRDQQKPISENVKKPQAANYPEPIPEKFPTHDPDEPIPDYLTIDASLMERLINAFDGSNYKTFADLQRLFTNDEIDNSIMAGNLEVCDDYLQLHTETDYDYDENPGPSAKVMAQLVNAYNKERFQTCDHLREFFDEQEIKRFVERGLLKVCDNKEYLELCL